MAREERLAKMQRWLDEGLAGQGITCAREQREFGVSAATVKRDVDYLRDRFGVPVAWMPGRRAGICSSGPDRKASSISCQACGSVLKKFTPC